ncbi:SAF domain-containing protein [Bifidobacterium callimiconis]|uniref:Flagellar basal body P-ring biosynthesis protein FlgA n=1 Tax=Bifidobacterium callimiconis TaxID=2306973 RepID=A0A430FCF2_9BIFI|nr:SAF domain-containing protein [Bifidobacterium callimiconis]MBT1177419.1 flagella basal body P-ring formation protein FlgA [Bifidobacterium callimiconis]RSX50472.1 flagellar basal body P-ring biosynthesis protein FlgA [Bifidobacterium callimiconis]
MPFSLFSSSSRRRDDTVAARRRRALVRRLTIAVCAGLSVWLILQCLMSLVARGPVAVASASISRGSTITAASVTIEQVPVSAITESAFSSADDVDGLIAQVDIAKGEPIMRGMATRAPVVAADHTAVEITVSSSTDALMPGRAVRLVAADRVLAESAMVVKVPERGSDDSSGILSGRGGDDATVTVALTAEEAMAVLAAQEAGPILAVALSDD